MTGFFNKMFGSKKSSSSAQPKPFVANDRNGEVQTAMLLRGLDDPTDYQWRLSLKVGDLIDVLDRTDRWRVAKIVRCTDANLSVKFEDTGQIFDLAVHRGGSRVAKPFTLSASPTHSHESPERPVVAVSQPLGFVQTQLPTGPHDNSTSHSSNSSHHPHLHIHPALTSVQTSTTPLTPWQPNLVEYAIGADNIIHQPEPPMTSGRRGEMIVIPMSKDNSCMFHSIAFVCDGRKTRKGLHVMQQRLRAHELVLADPDTYNEVVLGAPPADYCRRLLNLQTWGSAIEIGLFSSLYECEIFSFDYSQPTVYRFGEEHGYSKRVFIVYSGNHYDALAFVEGDGTDQNNQQIQEFFSTCDAHALSLAQAVVEKLYCHKTKQPLSLAAHDQIEWKGKGLYELNASSDQALAQRDAKVANNTDHPHHLRNMHVQTNVRPLINSVSITTPKSHQSGSNFSFSRSSINLLQQQPNSAPTQRELEHIRFVGQVGHDGSLQRVERSPSPAIPPRPMLAAIPGSGPSSTRVSPSLPARAFDSPEMNGSSPSIIAISRIQPSLDPVLEDDQLIDQHPDHLKVSSALENLRVRDVPGVK